MVRATRRASTKRPSIGTGAGYATLSVALLGYKWTKIPVGDSAPEALTAITARTWGDLLPQARCV